MPHKDTKMATNCHCMAGAIVEYCPVHSGGEEPIYDPNYGGDLRESVKASLRDDKPDMLFFRYLRRH